MPTLFISDLHLDASRPEALSTFAELLDSLDDAIDAIYILGDLFEFWNGDDDLSEAHLAIINSLKAIGNRGVPGYFMAGNRDFLVGKTFAEMSGLSLLPDPTIIELYKQRCLLMHGDSLCTDDHGYQRFRRFTHNLWAQKIYRWLPLSLRRRISNRVRQISTEENQKKAPEIMDVNEEAVIAAMRDHDVNLMIHGHTHRPAIHDFTLNEKASRRIVLGDWYRSDSVLVCGRGGQELMRVKDFLRTR